MKIRTPLFAVLGLLLCSAAATFAAQVTFQVNMSAQIALGNFNPALDLLFVAGDPLNGWSTSDSPLAPSTGDPNIWTGTFDVAGTTGSTAQYKFLIITTSATTWEGNVGSAGGNGNRTFTLEDTNQTLPVVYFNNVSSGTTVSSEVTFQVNMSVQIALGVFDPDSGTVSVAGELNSWNASEFELKRSLSDTNLWTGTRTLTGPVNGSILYKFVMNGGTWEGNVGPNGAQNRSVTLSNGAQTVPVAFFNNVASVPTNIPITFQVNLAALIAQGTFDPAVGTASVAGDLLNNWNATASVLTRSAANPNLWTGTFEISSTAGAVVLYKFIINETTWEGNVGPDGTQNRTYTLASTDPQILPIAFFNNVNNLGAITYSPVAGGQLTLSWTAGPGIQLQTSTDLNGSVWQNVPNTLGQSTTTVSVASSTAFFRLVGP